MYILMVMTRHSPATKQKSRVMCLERAFPTEWICMASSLVGVRMSTRVTRVCVGLNNSLSRMGSMNAAVFPGGSKEQLLKHNKNRTSPRVSLTQKHRKLLSKGQLGGSSHFEGLSSLWRFVQ